MQYKVAICDDILYYAEELEKYIEVYGKENNYQICTNKYLKGEDLICDILEKPFDIVFLDIEMPGKNGIKIAQTIREFNADIIIIFITSHEDYAYQASKCEMLDYIIKPIHKDRLYRTLNKALMIVQSRYDKEDKLEELLEICVEREIVILKAEKIICLEKFRNKISILYSDGKVYSHYETIKKLDEKLNSKIFIKINSGTIVNLNYVKKLKDGCCFISINNKTKNIKISRSKYKIVKERFIENLKDSLN